MTGEKKRSPGGLRWKRGKAEPSDDRPEAVSLVERDHAVLEGEEGPVATNADILAGVQAGAALTDEDVAGEDGLPAEALDAATLGMAFATVAGCSLTFLVSHDEILLI
jgi:hypothetical protein